MQLALGTVQLGMDYGVSNKKGKPSIGEVEKLLAGCQANDITILDTAQAYGESERVLGGFDLHGFRVISKILGDGSIEESLARLRIPKLYGLMFHREEDVTDSSWKRFEQFKVRGLVEKIGVSVYSPAKLAELIERYPIDLVQLPMNLLDQRFMPLLPRLKERKIEIHTRSAFLQGLLLMDPLGIHDYFSPIRPLLQQLPDPRMVHAFQFLKQQVEIDVIVVGVTSWNEMQEVACAYQALVPQMDYSRFSMKDESFINPSLWRL